MKRTPIGFDFLLAYSLAIVYPADLDIKTMRRLLIVEDDQNILDSLVFAVSDIPNVEISQ